MLPSKAGKKNLISIYSEILTDKYNDKGLDEEHHSLPHPIADMWEFGVVYFLVAYIPLFI